jgi:RHS repeat-associated protein
VVDALSKTTTYAYTPFGDLQQIKDSLGNTTTLTYDIRGRRTQVNDPDMGAWIYAYNAFGDLTSQTDAKANIVQMTYDKLSRVLTKISGSQNYSWTYDTATNGKGMPANVTGPAYQETYTYDSLARPQNVSTTLSGTTYTVTSSYDAYSRLSQLTYPSSGSSRFSAVYQYTANGYLQKVTSSSGITVYWTANTRNALGQVTEEALGNSLVTDNTFDPATGRLTAITTGSSVQSLSYTYDTLGNLLTREDNLKSLTETFTYDVANRVTGVTGPQNKTYSYNEIGNILNKSDVGAYTYGGTRPHAVTAAGGVNYTYDNNGNIISDSSGRNISFDGFNRPTQITKTGASGTLVYDAYDCLVEQILTKGSTTTTTIYIGNLFEQVTTGSVTEYKNYILAEGQQVATCDYYKGQGDHYIFYLHKDHLGSTDVTTNSSGGVVDGLSYDPFGMRRNATTWMDQAGITCSTTDYGYTGHIQLDTFGLIHMGARIYDPKLGRYISPDNVVQNVADSQALNRYSYCANNPLRYVDPTGNDFLDDLYNGACDLFSSGLDYLAAGFGSLNEYLTSLITPQPTLDLNSTLGLSSNSASTNTSFSSNLQQALSNAAAQAIDLGLQAATTAPSPEQSTQNVAATTTISTQVIPPPLLLAAANTGIANDANPAIYMNQSAQIAENQPTGTILADQGSNLINIAEGLLGQPYSKYDCSHLVWAVINMAGYYFPYTQTTNLPNSGLIDKIDPSQAQIGDIELFRHADGTPYHEGFYNPNSTAIGWQDNEQYPATLLQSSAKRGVSYSPDIWYGTPEYYRLKVPDQP